MAMITLDQALEAGTEVKPLPTWVAMPLCVLALPVMLIGIVAAMIWYLGMVGWATGWWFTVRFEAYIRRPPQDNGPTGPR